MTRPVNTCQGRIIAHQISHDSTVDTYFLSTRQSVTQAVMMDPTAELRAGLALQPGLRLPQPESYAATLADRSLPV